MSVSTHNRRTQLWVGCSLYLYLAITLFLPLAVIAMWAFYDPKVGWFPPNIVPRSFSVSAWREVLSDRQILPSAMLSLFVSTVVTVLTGLLAFPTAWALAQFPFKLKRAVEVFVLAPLIVPGIVVAVSLGEVFFSFGLSGTVLGVILVQTIGTLPLMIRILTATLEGIPKELILAARTLGASQRTAVRRIALPLAWPGFFAAGLLNFIASFEEFEKSFMVGAPQVQTLAVRLWSYLGGAVLVLPTAAVVTFILLVPMLVIFFIAERMLKEDVMASGLGKL
ncbi:ABC transporter permease [Kaistia adipata]|uniref:ABC transporter permease n=1 Tax=Kaistia adipata TaxID=166954 RepID=UPI00041D8D8F|nr:ABC transporter permease [Kaistia adipata]